MSVPNTSTFGLTDVTVEIYGDIAAGRNLRQCFVDATGTFDPNYVGSKNSLLNFRNYVHSAPLPDLMVSTQGVNNSVYFGWCDTDGLLTYETIPIDVLIYYEVYVGGQWQTNQVGVIPANEPFSQVYYYQETVDSSMITWTDPASYNDRLILIFNA